MVVTVSKAVSDRKAKEARALRFGFYAVLVIVILDLIYRNIAPFIEEYVWPGVSLKPFWDFYIAWEFASIASTLAVTIVYWFKYVKHDDDNIAYTDVFQHGDKIILTWLLVPLSAVALSFAAASAVVAACYKESSEVQIIWLVIEAFLLCVGVFCLIYAEKKIIEAAPKAIDMVQKNIDEKQRLLELDADTEIKFQMKEELDKLYRKRADYIDIRDDIAKAFSFSDVPIGAAFFLIFLLALVHWLGWTGAEVKLLSPFVAGAVTLQLLYSNFVFYIEANGAFPGWARRIWPILNELTPMIQGRLNGSPDPGSKSTGTHATATNQPPANQSPFS